MPDQPPPHLLPRVTDPAGRPAAPPRTDALSLDDTVQTYGVSVSTLRRKLRAGEVPGAYKVPGPKGDEWRIPAGAIEQLGYRPTGAPPPPPAAAPAPVAAMEEPVIARVVEQLADLLAAERRQLQAAEEDRGRALQDREDARVQAAELRGQLDAVTARAARLEQDLAQARRRWWRRS